MGKHLQKALDNVKDGRIILPIRAATGSINKEIEKQNLMLFLNNHRAHGQQTLQMMGLLNNPMLPPEQQDYICQYIMASTYLMRRIAKDFIPEGDPDQFIPDAMGIQEKSEKIQQQAQQKKMMEMIQQIMQQQRGGQGEQQQQPQLPAGEPGGNAMSAPPTDRMPTQ